MDNTIEKLIDIINSFFGCDAAYYDVNPFDLATHLIANGVTLDNQVSKWIPVTERLPDLELVEVKTDDNDLFPCLAVRKHPRAKNGKYTAKVWYDGYGFIDGISNATAPTAERRMIMKQTICPNCGGSLESVTIGWRCKKCKGFISLQDGKFFEYVEKPFMPPQTHADRIRAMSDEELAEFISNCGCPNHSMDCMKSCKDCTLKWLKQPAEVDNG